MLITHDRVIRRNYNLERIDNQFSVDQDRRLIVENRQQVLLQSFDIFDISKITQAQVFPIFQTIGLHQFHSDCFIYSQDVKDQSVGDEFYMVRDNLDVSSKIFISSKH